MRLGSVIKLQSGQDLLPNQYSATKGGLPYITGASCFNNKNLIINRWTQQGSSFAFKGDLLLTCKGTVGLLSILEEEKVHIARQVMAVQPYNRYSMGYIMLFIETQIKHMQNKAKGLIPGITRNDILLSLVPLPPLSEQQRIVDKVNGLLTLIDKL